jgi:glucose/arabinose dehydrogenase
VVKLAGKSTKGQNPKNGNSQFFKPANFKIINAVVFSVVFAAVGGYFIFKSFAASALVTNFNITPYATGFASPSDIANAGDNRLFVVQKTGQIKVINSDGSVRATPFLDIDPLVINGGTEQGLLGLSFHPNYASNRYFYIFYTNLSGDNVVARYQTSASDPNVADPASAQIIMTIAHPTNNNHNGGNLNFGPNDGYLYIGTGDGGGAGDVPNNAQNINILLGKLLRVDVNKDDFPSDTSKNYAIPSDNPYAGATAGADEIWALGLRNPWRYEFDRLTKDMIIGDVGQGAHEEVDFVPSGTGRGNNYGWRCYEGLSSYNTAGCAPQSSYVSPITDYDHTLGRCSITGGFVYRGTEFSTLQGVYIYADYCSGHFYGIKQNGSAWDQVLAQQFSGRNISSFGEDIAGRLYAADITNGTIYKLQADTAAIDTTAPTVSISTPASNATVSGSNVAVGVNASDNVGVAGVQLKVDGTYTGAEDTSAPYSINWNSLNSTNGLHNLTAVARDAAGNMTTSSAVPVNVFNGSSKPADINGDNVINITDLSLILSSYGQHTTQCSTNNAYKCDLSSPADGVVDIFDLSILLSAYGK